MTGEWIPLLVDRNVPLKGHNTNEDSYARIPLAATRPGSPALRAGSFTFRTENNGQPASSAKP